MIGGVAGRGDRLEGEAASGDARAVLERLVRRVVERMRGVGARRLAVGDDMAARADDRRAGSPLQQRRAAGVVAMAVGDDDARDALAGDRRQQRVEMGRVGRTGIDDRNLALADDVDAGAGEGERRRVGGDDPAHALAEPRQAAWRPFGAPWGRQVVRRLSQRSVPPRRRAACSPRRACLYRLPTPNAIPPDGNDAGGHGRGPA